MACNVTTNSELDSNESNQNNSVKTVGANKSSNTVCDVEENITKITDLDGTQSVSLFIKSNKENLIPF